MPRLLYLADDSQDQDAMLKTLKSIYGYQDEGPQPYGWRQMSLVLWKLVSSAEYAGQGKEGSEDPPDVKQIVDKALCQEIMRLAKLLNTPAEVEALRLEHSLAAARVPSQEVSDRLLRY